MSHQLLRKADCFQVDEACLYLHYLSGMKLSPTFLKSSNIAELVRELVESCQPWCKKRSEELWDTWQPLLRDTSDELSDPFFGFSGR